MFAGLAQRLPSHRWVLGDARGRCPAGFALCNQRRRAKITVEQIKRQVRWIGPQDASYPSAAKVPQSANAAARTAWAGNAGSNGAFIVVCT